MSENPIIAKAQALLGEFSRRLHFTEEDDMVLAKPKQFLSRDTHEELQRRVEELGGRYVNHNTGFAIPKATLTRDVPLEKPAEESIKIIPEETKPVGFEPTTPMESIPRTEVLTINVKLDNLETSVFSPRKTFLQRYIDELAEDIERDGQLKPIVVRPHPEKPHVCQVIDGEHRVRAFRKLGRSLIRAEVMMLSDEEAFFLAMRVNQMHGKRLEPLEEALHIKKMMEEQKLSQQQIATKFRRTQAWVSQRLNLITDLSPKVQEKIITRVIKSKHAYEISKLPKDKQDKVAEFVGKEKPSVKETRFLIGLVEKEPSEAEKLLSSDKLYLKADMKHEEIVETSKRFDELSQKSKEPWQNEHVCVNCGSKFKVNWEEGTIQWSSEPTASTT